eukprot:Gb_11771 [translate_table: standard]
MAAQMLSIASPAQWSSSPNDSAHLPQPAIKSHAIATFCNPSPISRLQKSESSSFFVGTSAFSFRKSFSVSFRPRRGHQPIFMMLPTANPERASPEKLSKWSARAIKSFSMAELEARKLKYPTTGTEALLMGILTEGTSPAAKFLRANGATLFKVREETIKLLGKSDMYFFSPEHPPLTEPAQKALDWAVDEKMKSGESGEVTTIHMLLGIWAQKDSAGHQVLAALGFDDKKFEELANSIKEEVALSSN